MNKTELIINKGAISEALILTIIPSNATGDKSVIWSTSDTAIATVSSTGQVTGVEPGTTQINARTSNGKIATCTVTVLVPASGIKINSDSFNIDKGSSKTLTATITPTNATDRDIAWATSNADVLSVDSNGKITAEDVGTAVITASIANGKISSTCDVTVDISLSKLTLEKSELSLIKGSQETLTASVDPPDTTENQTIQWTSTNPNVATVDSNGTIQAVGGGTATITAQVGSHVAECAVTVVVPAQGIAINKSTMRLKTGSEELLIATVFPEDTSDAAVEWTSSDNSVATVNGSGKVKAVGLGTATITATSHDGGFTADCIVSVVIPVRGITLDKTELHLIRGDSTNLIPIVTPTNATDPSVLWISSNESIATVDPSGKVTAVGVGTAIIKAITNDGGFVAECPVAVTPDEYTITANVASGHVDGAGAHHVGSVVTLTVTADEHYHFVNWTNSSGTVIGTSSTYVINGLNADMVINANIAIDVHTVTVSAGLGGSATPSGDYAYGSNITLTAAPDDKYKFVNWTNSEGGTETNPSFTYTVQGNITWTANFERVYIVGDSYTLSGYNWKIINIDWSTGQAILLCDNNFGPDAFTSSSTTASWAYGSTDAELSYYLNHTFYNSLTSDAKAKIITRVNTYSYYDSGSYARGSMSNNVWLLSPGEIFPSSSLLLSDGTSQLQWFAQNNSDSARASIFGGQVQWSRCGSTTTAWKRSIITVNADGSINTNGLTSNTQNAYYKPAILINLF